ncbi:MAG: siderophore-interacting protein [Comamonas sp.]|nr:siderophore-interacting protein [Comamonas sp.]
MPVQTLEPLVQRVRYPFTARHVQLLAREALSPGFVRLTLGGPDLAGFASPGFDDHVKLALPQEGRDKPNLPVLVDGIPIVEGARATMRDYTPLNHDGARHTVQLEFAVHGDGPAAHWARTAPLGQWVGLVGPRGSMLIPMELDWHLLLGDESAMPAIERRLAELPEGTQAIVRVQLADPADGRAWRSRATLDCVFTDSLAQAVRQLAVPAGAGFVWGGGEHALMAALREPLLSKGVDARRIRLSAYWKRGVAGHASRSITASR